MKLVITDLAESNFSITGEHKIIRPGAIAPCIGCFGCWVQTPGRCVIHDGWETLGETLGKSEELILISACCWGSVSPFVKTAQDRILSFFLPDFEIRRGEMHHKLRYKGTRSLTAVFYGSVTEHERETAEKLMRANAVNYSASLAAVHFCASAKDTEGVSL